ncbi:restriction endonuclease subunit S [Rudanella paleaurantiibacter]|uniref:Restriction endonuclease subunit S n=1 Tax=Rudanella paleaurantiibacter TaxID=2614655 RepID=A0A7J5U2R0_9BACT|nr:restriction endonuclease subunit S [Rudanella paleaurantiibacter]KAB7731918.1 restriction endonuclease subunit S [Rudanella paleaurantiibacter]
MNGSFPSHWQLLLLEEAMEAIIDYRGKTPIKSDSGVPLITAKIVKNGRIEQPTEFIADELYDSWMVRGLPKQGDIVITTEAPLGEVAQIEDSYVALAQRIVTLRGKSDVLDNDYLLFLMQSEFVQNQLVARASGSTVLGIKQSELRKILLVAPPIDEQIKIGQTLKSITTKIALNRQINQTLEAMAQALFKSWFVDFEPVRARIAALETGEDPTRAAMRAISGKTDAELGTLQTTDPDAYAQLETTASLFPDALVDSELGLVPEGWEVRELSRVTTEIRRGITPKYAIEGGVLVINQKCIRNHAINFSEARRHDDKERGIIGREVAIGDVLINSTGVGTLGRLAPVKYLPERTVIDTHVTVVRANHVINYCYLASFFLTKESQIESSGAGSTGQTELRRQVLEDLKLIIPSKELLELYETQYKPILKLMAKNEQEQIISATLRDTLLPKLLSGEIDLSKLEGIC